MRDEERRKLDNQLIGMGLRQMNDPELVPMMAALITDHAFFGALLGECDADKRTDMYEAIRPHLKFEPWPLDRYIAKIKERAGNIESAAEPIKVGGRKYEEVSKLQATHVLVTLKCACGRTADFCAETPVSAVILARQDGWVRDRALGREVCPKCPSPDRLERRVCQVCTRRHYPPQCRMSDILNNNPQLAEKLVD